MTATSANKYLAQIGMGGSGASISGLQTIDYQYHIRGGLRGINLDASGNPTPNVSEADLFSYKLDYETAGYFDGNIGKQSWNNGTAQRNYTYTYDASSRLKSAIYSGVNGEDYSIPNMNYDRNGNITNLQRRGKINPSGSWGLMDNLSYGYNGNRLTQITDGISGDNEVDFVQRSGANYSFYDDGSLKSDANKEITLINYDGYLGKPIEIQLTGGRWIKMYYAGSGSLLKREFSTGEKWEFGDGGLVYKNGRGGQPQPYQMNTPEGRAIYQNGVWHNEFSYTDHLGNALVSFRANGSQLEKVDETAFDPTGIVLNGLGQENSFENRFKFQGQEKIPQLGWYDFGNRMYDPTTVHWNRPDRLADKYYNLSPYAAFGGNPLRYSDMNGDSLVVLSAPNGAHGAGHAAVLIGNDKSGWKLFSKNGTNGKSGLKGPNDVGDNKGEKGTGQFKTLEDFANSPNSPQTTDKTEEGKPEYQEGFMIASDSKADAKMVSGAKEVLNEDYRLLTSSCIDVCSNALAKGGFDPGHAKILGVTVRGLGWETPNFRFKDIKANNNGVDVTKRILPKK